MSDSRLVDPFDRRITYLCLSVVDRCGFHCAYCTDGSIRFLPRDQVLSPGELYTVTDTFIGLDVRCIRITGGGPLVHKDVTGLLTRLGQYAGLGDLAITTNDSQLREHATELKAAGVRRLNVSLDSLQCERSAAFTRNNHLGQVLDDIQATHETGFERIKLDCVVQKDRNDDKILDLIECALANQLGISFIEEVSSGSITSHRRELALYTSDEVRAIIEHRWPLTPSLARSGKPSRYCQIGDELSRIGFASSCSNNFCGDCNRVRVTAEDKLVLHLDHERTLDLRRLLCSHPDGREHLNAALVAALNLKPGRHHLDVQEQAQVSRFMSMTGD